MDEKKYPDPQTFKPERYADYPLSGPEYAAMSGDDVRDHYGYGYGRRICVGMHIVSHFSHCRVLNCLMSLLEKGGTINVHQHCSHCVGFQYQGGSHVAS